MFKNSCIFIFLASFFIACTNGKQSSDKSDSSPYKTIGSIERLSLEMDALLDTAASIEILAEGFSWAEGPVWVPQLNAVLFSDVPTNTLYKWTEEMGKEIYLKPSGSTGAAPHSLDQGSNGLTISSDGSL
ncbi:MAG: SMP-30/gluconolactonase/LRE family protein, partial [Ekhidna sp.]